ncbi:hypothetical protein [Nocardioides aequoreus]|uniref:hypothetical protein n=1 Tax=Nocardioides aequoreus TaxID=397278 RepID=UPI0004C34F02|nr:hypothetical protein [Nocardioides aequoreus]
MRDVGLALRLRLQTATLLGATDADELGAVAVADVTGGPTEGVAGWNSPAALTFTERCTVVTVTVLPVRLWIRFGKPGIFLELWSVSLATGFGSALLIFLRFARILRFVAGVCPSAS